ncbi:MAG: hypothetical protein I8H75_04945 [Myxococcaceae bacterium]|nr:hypothetical protein [Myxococcaceae bacterium]MBH2006672.1 hypothetical protein [Myxococcaceae bacterium]
MNRFLVLLWLSTSAVSGTYTYHPSNALFLGAGFDPRFPDQAFANCIEFQERVHVDGNSAIKTEYSLSLVKSKQELFDRLNISSSLSARSLFFHLSAGASYFSQHRLHSDSITWMILGKSEYGRYVIQNPQLNPLAKHLIEQREFEQFARQCGTEFIRQERRAVMVAAIFSVENVNQEDRRRLEMHFEASTSALFFDASLKTRYERFVSEASRLNRVNLSFYAIGGSGITELANLAIHADDLENVQRTLERYMKTLDESKAVPVEYVSASMASFGWLGGTPALLHQRERVLAQLYHQHEEANSIRTRLAQILTPKGDGPSKVLSTLEHQTYTNRYHEYGQYLKAILKAADLCHASLDQCEPLSCHLSKIVWPMNHLSLCDKLRQKALHGNQIDEEELEELERMKLAPILDPSTQKIGAYKLCR